MAALVPLDKLQALCKQKTISLPALHDPALDAATPSLPHVRPLYLVPYSSRIPGQQSNGMGTTFLHVDADFYPLRLSIALHIQLPTTLTSPSSRIKLLLFLFIAIPHIRRRVCPQFR